MKPGIVERGLACFTSGSEETRREDIMLRELRTVALAVTMIVAGGGFAAAQDGYHYDRGNYGYDDDRASLRAARDIGAADGALVARQDLAHGKPYNPYPRGKYAHRDHGYRHEYGDKYAYMESYANGYRNGYERTFQRY